MKRIKSDEINTLLISNNEINHMLQTLCCNHTITCSKNHIEENNEKAILIIKNLKYQNIFLSEMYEKECVKKKILQDAILVAL